jgi:hypothetical protein
LLAVLLLLSVINYSRISANSTIRTIEFISVLAIGILTGLLLREFFENNVNKKAKFIIFEHEPTAVFFSHYICFVSSK